MLTWAILEVLYQEMTLVIMFSLSVQYICMPLPLYFSAADANLQIASDVRDLGPPLDMTFTLSLHCKLAANTAGRLLSIVHR